MKTDITKEIEKHREEMRQEIEKLRREAKEKGVCPNCGNPVTNPRRLYCSDQCSWDFQDKHDYSQKSPIIASLKKELKSELKAEPKNPTPSITYPKAMKEYRCTVCNLQILKEERHAKYTILPGDDQFIDYPYEVIRYHEGCYYFLTGILWSGNFDVEEGVDDEDISMLLSAFSNLLKTPMPEFIKQVRNGMISKETVEAIMKDNDYYDLRQASGMGDADE